MSHIIVNWVKVSGETPASKAGSITFLHEMGGHRGAINMQDGERLELELHEQSHDQFDRLFERHVIERHGGELRLELYTEVENEFLCDGPFSFSEFRVCAFDNELRSRSTGLQPMYLPVEVSLPYSYT